MPIQLVSNGKRRPIFQIFSEILQYIKSFTGSTTEENGSAGLVPSPLVADKDKFLKGDGTWATVTMPSVYQGATTEAQGIAGLVPAASVSEASSYLKGDGTWGEVSLEPFTGCSESVSGAQGLVPAPTRGSNMYFLKSTGGWAPVSNVIYPDALKAASAITTGYLIVGDENGYKHLAAGATFDVGYPILVNIGTNVAAGNTFSTAWLSMNNKRFSSSGFNNLTVTKDKMCYVMGTLSGRTFTIDSTTPITQDIPNTENGKVYMKLGIASSSNAVSFVSSNDLYEFRDGVFGPYKGADSIDHSTLVTIADNQTITGIKTFDKNTFSSSVALTGNSIDVSTGSVFTKTVTSDITLTFTGVPTGKTGMFTLVLTNGGACDVTFPNNIVWASSYAPELKTSGVDILTFFTPDGGTTWYDCGDSTDVYVGASSGADGIAGLVPPARYAQRDYFLKGDGTWAYVTENGMFTDFGGATDNANGRQGMVPAPYIADKNKFLRGDGTWYPINTYVGATTNTNGVSGLVPSAPIADKDKFLKGDGTWAEVNISDMMTTDTVQTVTGAKTFGNTYGTIQSIDATSGEVFIDGTSSTYIFTISTHTDITFTATITSGQTKVFTLIINNTPSSNYAVYWPMNVYWNAATPPVLHEKDVITFLGVYNPLTSRIEYYGTPSVIEAGTEAGVGGGII